MKDKTQSLNFAEFNVPDKSGGHLLLGWDTILSRSRTTNDFVVPLSSEHTIKLYVCFFKNTASFLIFVNTSIDKVI